MGGREYSGTPLGEKVNLSDVLDRANSEIAIGSKLGMDATKKLPGAGIKRPWPPLIKMDAEVKAKVEKLSSQGACEDRHSDMEIACRTLWRDRNHVIVSIIHGGRIGFWRCRFPISIIASKARLASEAPPAAIASVTGAK